jgi:hypothetical protein
VSTCRGCNAEITWAKVRARWDKPETNMPLDAEPVPDGEWLLDTEKGTASYVGKEPSLIPDNRHRAHWASCPEAEKFRGTKKATA